MDEATCGVGCGVAWAMDGLLGVDTGMAGSWSCWGDLLDSDEYGCMRGRFQLVSQIRKSLPSSARRVSICGLTNAAVSGETR